MRRFDPNTVQNGHIYYSVKGRKYSYIGFTSTFFCVLVLVIYEKNLEVSKLYANETRFFIFSYKGNSIL